MSFLRKVGYGIKEESVLDIELGRHDIDGDKVYILVQEYVNANTFFSKKAILRLSSPKMRICRKKRR